METQPINTKYVEWLSAEEMHEASRKWLSELNFLKDEHLFFEDLISSFTLQFISKDRYSNSKEIIDAINRSQKENKELIKLVKAHEYALHIMVDGIDQPEKEALYKKEHQELILSINAFTKDFKLIKAQLFDIIKRFKKEEKFQHLLDKK
jgi:hypothetical protein